MKKKLCFALALLMAATAISLSSCVDNSDKGNETNAPVDTVEGATTVEETKAPQADLPDVTYTGQTFRVWIQAGEENEYDFVTQEQETGEPLHDAIFKRNNAIQDRYGITIETTPIAYSDMTSQIRKTVKSGTDEFDFTLVQMVEGTSLALEGIFVPFSQLEYVDLSKPWWDKAVSSAFSIGGDLLLANGDISPSSFQVTSCMLFNKVLFKKYDMEYPYQLVKDGKWTLDAMYTLLEGKSVDAGNDGFKLEDDTFGLVTWWLDVPYSLYYGAGGMLAKKDETDTPYLDLTYDKNVAIYDKIYKIIIDENAYYSVNDFDGIYKTFADGRAFMIDTKFIGLQKLRDMENEYGILPIPKYDGDQENYFSFVNGCSNMLAVPISNKDLEKTSVLLEALACESYNTVTPILYETFLKRKLTTDAESMEMIDYVLRNRVFDLAYAGMQGGIGTFVRDLLSSKSTDVVSYFDKNSKSAKKKLTTMVEKYIAAIAE